MTARTSKPGVSISVEDLDALASGRQTLQSIADRERCSKQNISKRIRAMRAPAPTGPSIPAGSVAVDPVEIAVSACLGLLHRAHAALIGPDVLGPSALKALSTTISTATAELRQLGFLILDEADAPTELVVRVMTDEEHAETKRRAELADDCA